MAVTRIFTWTPTTETGFLNTELDNIIAALNAVAAGSTDISSYAKLAGRAGGQTLNGDTASGGTLKLVSSAHATKGKVLFGAAGTSAYDEVNDRLGIGTAAPGFDIHMQKSGNVTFEARVENTTAGTGARAALRAQVDTQSLFLAAYSSLQTTTRYGVTLAGWAEVLITGAGGGLAVGTFAPLPIVFWHGQRRAATHRREQHQDRNW
jgi:hypothetical protein